ncbi:peptidoglycan DD-metalloendopeptidase family protein [Pseudomonas sp. gcc21]|uniref:peptidoglycan DD-metalloendopeptidase family protein n=1 Tax=Pseudomonas sp. gcc21 TaxID=2726989 RepID=UPI001451C87E|nr:peptidoglycan DD-metalloendopeptidase family protein [Pseudomonas sp. gcc21]QJD58792.1 peptidoglycan DD-metalloendopeptidase family protein [Pseudomonas sp. gcc21]
MGRSVFDRHLVIINSKRALLILAVSLLTACAGPAGMVPIDDRSRGGQRAEPAPASGLHTVSRGETLYQIAFRYGKDWKSVAAANGLRQPFTIYPGQRLRVGPSQSYARSPTKPRTTETIGLRTTVRPAGTVTSKPSPTPPAAVPRATPRTTPPAVTSRPSAPTAKPAPSAKPATPAPVAKVPTNVDGWNWPAEGALISRFQSNGSLNKGIDIAGEMGQPVKAAANGAVVYAGRGLIGYGDMIIIKHDQTYLSAYAHNSRLLVKEGDQVKAGQKVAEMGNSGTDRVKLHFEIRRQGKPVDPLSYLPKR